MQQPQPPAWSFLLTPASLTLYRDGAIWGMSSSAPPASGGARYWQGASTYDRLQGHAAYLLDAARAFGAAASGGRGDGDFLAMAAEAWSQLVLLLAQQQPGGSSSGRRYRERDQGDGQQGRGEDEYAWHQPPVMRAEERPQLQQPGMTS
jgi:hypothetical protein